MYNFIKGGFLGLCFLLQVHGAFAQVRFSAADLPLIGDTLYFAIDENFEVFDLDLTGTDLNWDFRNLYPNTLAQNIYLDPVQTPFSETFPAANIALVVDFGDPSYSYLLQSDSAIFILGLTLDVPQLGGQQLLRFQDTQKFASIPTELGTSFVDTARVSFDLTEPTTGADLVYRSLQITQSSTAASGTIQLPSGDYSALRQLVVTERRDSLFVVILGRENFFDSQTSTDSLYVWVAPAAKGVICSTDGKGTVTYYAPELANLKAPQAAFVYEQAGDGLVDYSDASTGIPFTWDWDFGDGQTSDKKDLTHRYDSSATYSVCLTVANTSGTDQSCQEVSILVTDIDDWWDGEGLAVFPNPVGDILRFQSSDFSRKTFKIFDPQGRLFRQGDFTNEMAFQVNSWAPGIYSYQLIRADGKWRSGKLVVH